MFVTWRLLEWLVWGKTHSPEEFVFKEGFTRFFFGYFTVYFSFHDNGDEPFVPEKNCPIIFIFLLIVEFVTLFFYHLLRPALLHSSNVLFIWFLSFSYEATSPSPPFSCIPLVSSSRPWFHNHTIEYSKRMFLQIFFFQVLLEYLLVRRVLFSLESSFYYRDSSSFVCDLIAVRCCRVVAVNSQIRLFTVSVHCRIAFIITLWLLYRIKVTKRDYVNNNKHPVQYDDTCVHLRS